LIVACQQQFLGCLRTGDPRQQQRDGAGAELDLRRSESRRLRSHGHVAGKRKLECAADAIAVHRSDRRLLAIPELHDEVEVGFERLAPLVRPALAGRCGARLEVEAGGKRAAGAANHDRRHRRVRGQRASAPVDSSMSSGSKAFSTFGRLKVSTAMRSSISTASVL
jgi:hypothetical protein